MSCGTFCWRFAAAVSLGAVAPAPPDDEAQAVIERAVKAHGGFGASPGFAPTG